MEDIVLIDGFEYPIHQITDDGIYVTTPDNSQSLIRYIPRIGWQVEGYPHKHEVKFIRRTSPIINESEGESLEFPLPEEIEMKIMLTLSDEQLFEICQENLISICNNEHFWMFRTLQEFGLFVLKNRPLDETHKQQYYSIIDFINWFNHNYEIKHYYILQRPDWLLAAISRLPDDTTTYLIISLMNLNDEELWHFIKPSIIRIALNNRDEMIGYLKNKNILPWLLTQFNEDDLLLQELANYAAVLSDLEILEYLSSKNVLPSMDAIMAAAQYNHLNVIEWAISKGLIIIQRFMRKFRFYWPHILGIYKLLHQYGLINQRNFNRIKRYAKEEERIDILEWLLSIGVISERRFRKYITQSIEEKIENATAEELTEIKSKAMRRSELKTLKILDNKGLLTDEDWDLLNQIASGSPSHLQIFYEFKPHWRPIINEKIKLSQYHQ